jgi:hypothetical protein
MMVSIIIDYYWYWLESIPLSFIIYNYRPVISGFCHEVDDKWALLSYYEASIGIGPIGCPETSVINYQYSLRNNPEDRRSQL